MYGILTYIWVIYGVNVGKYASTMEHLGMITLTPPSLSPDFVTHFAQQLGREMHSPMKTPTNDDRWKAKIKMVPADVYICIFVYIYNHIYIYIFVCMYVYIYTQLYIDIHK